MIMMTEPDKTTYWQRVETALEIVGVGPDLARELRSDVNNLSERQQELFYHAEPLDIARDITGITQLSSEQLERYLGLQTEPSKTQPVLERLRDPLFSSKGKLQIEVSNVVRQLEQEMILRELAEKTRLSESEVRVLSRLMEFEATFARRTATVVAGVGLLTVAGVLVGSAWFASGSIPTILLTISLLVSIGSVFARGIAIHFLSRSVADKKTAEETEKRAPVR